ncbi:unnamed protein product, partial [marine sediment metagenome]
AKWCTTSGTEVSVPALPATLEVPLNIRSPVLPDVSSESFILIPV